MAFSLSGRDLGVKGKVSNTYFVRWVTQTFAIRACETRLPHLSLAVNVKDLNTVNLESVVFLPHDRQDPETVEKTESVGSQVHSATDHTGLGPDLVDGDNGR